MHNHFSESASISSGTLILSSQVGKQNGTSTAIVNDPVTITFQIIPENFSNPSCVFWEFSVPYVTSLSVSMLC